MKWLVYLGINGTGVNAQNVGNPEMSNTIGICVKASAGVAEKNSLNSMFGRGASVLPVARPVMNSITGISAYALAAEGNGTSGTAASAPYVAK